MLAISRFCFLIKYKRRSKGPSNESKNILRDLKEIKIIEFDHNDVVRHPLVSKIVKAYSKND